MILTWAINAPEAENGTSSRTVGWVESRKGFVMLTSWNQSSAPIILSTDAEPIKINLYDLIF